MNGFWHLRDKLSKDDGMLLKGPRLIIPGELQEEYLSQMPFGTKMSQDVFQLRMDAILEQCPGVIGIQDDMVIFGVDQEDHDANLINLLNVCQKEGLVLNSKKLELRRERVTFFGVEYSAQGMHPDPKKVQGITEMTAPTDKQQLQSFLGMVNYMGTFIPNLSHHTELLRAMLKKDNVFHWEEQQTRSFQQVKTLIVKANTTPLRYYHRNLPVTVQADASLRGLGACLIQKHNGEDQPIAFASKSLMDVETRYANIERELLAIVFACQQFSTYLLGRSFIAESDHKPLEMIAMKNLTNAPPHLQRMLLELQRYDVTIKYQPGKEMQLADALSRCPVRASQEIKLDMRVDYIANALHKNSDSETDRLQDINEEPRRCIGPSCVKELAKFFTPTSDEEENSRVNSRTRCKKLFEQKKEEESEK